MIGAIKRYEGCSTIKADHFVFCWGNIFTCNIVRLFIFTTLSVPQSGPNEFGISKWPGAFITLYRGYFLCACLDLHE